MLVFTGIDGPPWNLYMPRLAELAEFYRGRGVVFIGVNSNATESANRCWRTTESTAPCSLYY